MKGYFSTGVVILLPIVLTLVIVNFLINFLTAPFLESTQEFLRHFDFFHRSYFFLSSSVVTTLTSKLLILVILVGFILLIGFMAQHFLIDYLLAWGNYFIHRVPVVNKLYKAIQDTVHSLFSSSSKSSSQVVLVPYPNSELLSIGFAARASVQIPKEGEESNRVAVFVSGTPNPSMGYLLFYKPQDIVYVDMKVEQAMKSIVSCGVVMSDFKIIQPSTPSAKYDSTKTE